MSDRERLEAADRFMGLEAKGWVCTLEMGAHPLVRRPEWDGHSWMSPRIATAVQAYADAAREEEREACCRVIERCIQWANKDVEPGMECLAQAEASALKTALREIRAKART